MLISPCATRTSANTFFCVQPCICGIRALGNTSLLNFWCKTYWTVVHTKIMSCIFVCVTQGWASLKTSVSQIISKPILDGNIIITWTYGKACSCCVLCKLAIWTLGHFLTHSCEVGSAYMYVRELHVVLHYNKSGSPNWPSRHGLIHILRVFSVKSPTGHDF